MTHWHRVQRQQGSHPLTIRGAGEPFPAVKQQVGAGLSSKLILQVPGMHGADIGVIKEIPALARRRASIVSAHT